MRILFVASRLPYPPFQGDRARAYQQIRHLSQRHRITLVAPVRSGERETAAGALQSLCERIVTIPFSRGRGFLSVPRAFFSSLPFQSMFFCTPRIRRTIARLLDAGHYDLIHVQLIRMAPAAARISHVPRVLDLIDAMSLNWFRRADREGRTSAPFVRWEAGRMRRYERALMDQYTQGIVCSPVDRVSIGSYANLHVIPNGVELVEFPFTADGRDPATIVFTGRMGYFPNADAAEWFAKEVFPVVRGEVPNARFVIVGADVSPRIKSLERIHGIQVTGRVQSVHSYLARATVAVCPMRAGSGMQFKVLEAMASGAPIVATPHALGGIDAVPEQHLLVAESALSVAKKVVLLIGNDEQRRHLAQNARSLVEEKYTWDRCNVRLEDVYRLAVDGHRGC